MVLNCGHFDMKNELEGVKTDCAEQVGLLGKNTGDGSVKSASSSEYFPSSASGGAAATLGREGAIARCDSRLFFLGVLVNLYKDKPRGQHAKGREQAERVAGHFRTHIDYFGYPREREPHSW